MADDLSKRPDFGPKESMPWDSRPPEWEVQWPWGKLRGSPLWTLTSEQLVKQRNWIDWTGMGQEYLPIIDDILKSRAGE